LLVEKKKQDRIGTWGEKGESMGGEVWCNCHTTMQGKVRKKIFPLLAGVELLKKIPSTREHLQGEKTTSVGVGIGNPSALSAGGKIVLKARGTDWNEGRGKEDQGGGAHHDRTLQVDGLSCTREEGPQEWMKGGKKRRNASTELKSRTSGILDREKRDLVIRIRRERRTLTHGKGKTKVRSIRGK